MKQRKTTGILQSLDILDKIENGREEFSRELIDLDKTPKREYVKFWQYIDSCGDKFEESEADKRFAFKSAFGVSAKFSIRKANAMLRKLVLWIDEFAIDKEVEQSGYRDLVRAKYYFLKGESKSQKEVLGLALQKNSNSDKNSSSYINSQVHHDLYFYAESKGKKSTNLETLDKIEAETSEYFFSWIFKTTIEKFTYYRGLGKEIPLHKKQSFESLLAIIPKEHSSLIKVQVFAIKFLLEPSLDAYICFKKAYFQKIDKLKSEKKYLLLSLTNSMVVIQSCIDFMPEYLNLIRFSIKNKVFLSENYIEKELFDNIVFVIKSTDEIELLNEFIKTHYHLIRDKIERENCKLLAMCYLTFMEGSYCATFEKLTLIKPLYPVFKLRLYMLEFIAFYEKSKDKRETYSYIKEKEDGFRKLLIAYQEKGYIVEDQRRGFLNFLLIIYKITRPDNADNTAKALSALLESFHAKITERNWLEKKIKELE